MANTDSPVFYEAIGPNEGLGLRVKQALLIIGGILALAIAAKLKVPMIPVPITMGTLVVLTIGATYGPLMGFSTILGYMIVGALGFDVFVNSSAELNGLAYMSGSTGGYLIGYVLATIALGFFARRGWDRSFLTMAGAMLIGNILIYIPGLYWLGALYGWDKPILAWGLTPFLIGDFLKLALAAILLPTVWKLVGSARA
ncbi:MAG: biotin transporter BioY [Aestuariivita sp.]|nr:biotin transporter BioY [Aestuariivita sp.]